MILAIIAIIVVLALIHISVVNIAHAVRHISKNSQIEINLDAKEVGKAVAENLPKDIKLIKQKDCYASMCKMYAFGKCQDPDYERCLTRGIGTKK